MDNIRNSLSNLQNSFKSNLNNNNNNNSVLTSLSNFKNSYKSNLNNNNSLLSYNQQPSITSKLENSSSFFKNIMEYKIFIIILILIIFLAIFGFNIFTFLGKMFDYLITFFKNTFKGSGGLLAKTSKHTISDVADGTKKIITSSSDVLNTAIDTVDSGSRKGINVLEKTLDKASNIVNTENDENDENDENHDNHDNNTDEPAPAKSSNHKGGYCYIGKINDTRYCAKVSNKSFCMSGDIYPTRNLCVNPNIRA